MSKLKKIMRQVQVNRLLPLFTAEEAARIVDDRMPFFGYYTGMSTVQAQMGTTVKWQVGNDQTGYNQITTQDVLSKTQEFGTAEDNTSTGGGDEVYSFQQSIAAGGTATIDLTAMTNQLGQAAVSIVRAKGVQIRILSTEDDPDITPAPNANSTAVVTNIGPTLPSALDFQNNGSGLTLDVTVTGGLVTNTIINTAGSGYPASSFFLVSPNQNTGAGAGIAVTTNSGGVPIDLSLITNAAGTNYSNASNVPTTVLGQYKILTGGVHLYTDPKATGFLPISATAKNFKIVNNDSINAITAEITVFGCTS